MSIENESLRLKRIDQLDLASNGVIETWDSIIIASRMLNIKPQDILLVLQGKLETAGGFKWQVSSNQTTHASAAMVQQTGMCFVYLYYVSDLFILIISPIPLSLSNVYLSLALGEDDDEDDNYQKQAKEAATADWKTKLYEVSKEYRSGGTLRDYQVCTCTCCSSSGYCCRI